MLDLFHAFLCLHVLGAIVALGPTFVFPILGGMSAREPRHGAFALRLSLAIQNRLVIPLALSLAVTGVGLLVTADPAISLTESWLLASVVLYAGAMILALGVMRPSLIQLVALTSQPPGVPAGATPGGTGTGGPPAGPPRPVLELLRRQRLTGTILSVLIVVLVLLMVIQPGGAGA